MSDAGDHPVWIEANQRYLTAALREVKSALVRYSSRGESEMSGPELVQRTTAAEQGSEAIAPPAALQTLCQVFQLSSFEQALLLLCAGPELEADFGRCCAEAQGDSRRGLPTFSLALAALPNAHWSAIAPDGPLRRHRLIEMGPNEGIMGAPLRIDERILHYLTGLNMLDARLEALFEPLLPPRALAPSLGALAQRLARIWAEGGAGIVLQLCGPDPDDRAALAAYACAGLGLRLHTLRAVDLPAAPSDREGLGRLWEREAALLPSALLMDLEDSEAGEAAQRAAAFMDRTRAPLLLSSREPVRVGRRASVRFEVPVPGRTEREGLWRATLGPLAERLDGQLDRVVGQFRLGPTAIRAAGAELFHLPPGAASDELANHLWEACRSQARPKLQDLAQRIDASADWDDLILPEAQRRTLRAIAAHLRHRDKVVEQWGFAAKSQRGLGISALFHGSSGTGKTMAAEVLAHDLKLDIFRIDLSQVVNKYIGETEKNLRRVFDAAEGGSAVLLFDEADALFGKRSSEVKDSHDRYANIEVGYLLQRMEAYQGLAILTTNLRDALDSAFLRRIRFVVSFPFPDAAARAEIWRRIFPEQTPTAHLDFGHLARLHVAGGHIRNIALQAAFLAADGGEPVQMKHIALAARAEYLKLDKQLTAAEIGGWA